MVCSMGGGGLFESEEEQKENAVRTVIIVALIIAVVGLIVLSVAAWNSLKPLPQLTICKEKGYEGGSVIDGKKVCYKNCVDNELSHCKMIRVMV